MVRTRIQVHVADDAVFLHVPGDHTHALPGGVVHHQAPVAAILRRGTFGFCPGGGGIGPEAFQARTQVTHHATLAAGHVQLVDGHAQAIVGHEVQDVRVGGVPLRFGIAGWTVQHFFVFGRVGVVQVPVAVGGVHQELAAVGVEGLTARVITAVAFFAGTVLAVVGDAHLAGVVNRFLHSHAGGWNAAVGNLGGFLAFFQRQVARQYRGADVLAGRRGTEIAVAVVCGAAVLRGWRAAAVLLATAGAARTVVARVIAVAVAVAVGR